MIMTTSDKARTDNSTYKNLAVQWLNEALCSPTGGFSGGRQFCSS
jgi:hypothetical protein